MQATRDSILSANDVVPVMEKVEVPEWGGHVYIGVMSGVRRERFEDLYRKAIEGHGEHANHLRAIVAAFSVCGHDGIPFFTEADIPKLAEKSGKILDEILPIAYRVNAIGKKAVDEAGKNS